MGSKKGAQESCNGIYYNIVMASSVWYQSSLTTLSAIEEGLASRADGIKWDVSFIYI